MANPTALRPTIKNLFAHTLNASMLDYWLGKVNPSWSVDQARATIVEREQAAIDSVSLVLKPNRHFKKPQAGQHIMVSAEVEGRRIARSYSCSSITGNPELLEITIKQVSGGKLSQWLCQQAKVGDVLQLDQPFGELQWPSGDQSVQSVLLLAAGSGITPMISLLRQHLNQHNSQPVQLHYWVSKREQACFVAELEALSKMAANFSFCLYLTQQDAQTNDKKSSLQPYEQSSDQPYGQPYERQGRIEASHFAQITNLSTAAVLACGSAAFVANAQQLLQPQVASWQAEAFSPPQLPVFDAANDQQQTMQILLQKQQRSISVPVGQSILTALENEGIAHPSGCRMGLCNTCACGKVSGTTQHLISGDQQSDAESALRVCVSTAQTDLVLDI